MSSSIILMSGGLDSVVTLGVAKEEFNVSLALTFDYGQKSAQQEIKASRKVCNHYKIVHKIIKLDWLSAITQTALVSEALIPEEELGTEDSMKSVWVPNRNALFLNIAASFADSYGYNNILFGANAQEAQTFSDNTQEFIDRINSTFEFSTLVKPKVLAPLINMNKDAIVKIALERNVPLELVRSCYNSAESNCGKCESCKNLKSALVNNNRMDILGRLFDDENIVY